MIIQIFCNFNSQPFPSWVENLTICCYSRLCWKEWRLMGYQNNIFFILFNFSKIGVNTFKKFKKKISGSERNNYLQGFFTLGHKTIKTLILERLERKEIPLRSLFRTLTLYNGLFFSIFITICLKFSQLCWVSSFCNLFPLPPTFCSFAFLFSLTFFYCGSWTVKHLCVNLNCRN